MKYQTKTGNFTSLQLGCHRIVTAVNGILIVIYLQKRDETVKAEEVLPTGEPHLTGIHYDYNLYLPDEEEVCSDLPNH